MKEKNAKLERKGEVVELEREVREEKAATIVRVAGVVRAGRVEKVARVGKVGSGVMRMHVVRMGEAMRIHAHIRVGRRLTRAVTASDWW